ncbi:conserved membrane hypothetical protein [Sulfurovum sp. enrichment culture clone C5]|uniref:DUF2628 domain-containing protein n=1 Tax=Sulfurovum sp. enrichment culture clone C5 TaxID=497650 RepID=A0A0S4XNN4_9BACT|nr:conserved membrane hypothetical protein [Sulfurovum sp. enrichment culture clone C5]
MADNEVVEKTYDETWMKRFDFFKEHGAPNTQTFKDAFKPLPFGERVTIGMNFWAFFFSFIYFFIKGMWKKGLVLLGIFVLLSIIASIVGSQGLATGLRIAFGMLAGIIANYSFYQKEILGEDDYNIFKGMKL